MTAALQGMAIRSIAAYAPRNRVTNDMVAVRLQEERDAYERQLGRPLTDDEAELFMTNDRWIRRFIGITERRFVEPGEGTIDLATKAAQLLLHHQRDLDPASFDAIVFCTVTPSYLNSPPDAALLQRALDIREDDDGVPHELFGATASLACTSWVAGLQLSYGLIRSGLKRRILLIGADAMSTTINWRDRAFASVLGDAGTATELIAVPVEEDWFSPEGFWSWLGGSEAETIITPVGGSRRPLRDADDLARFRHCLRMDGRKVRDIIVPLIGGPAMDAALAKAGLRIEEIDWTALHEANRVLNAKILDLWRPRGFRGTVIDAGGLFGNTTSASIPLAIALNPDKLTPGSRFMVAGFGGGFSAAFCTGTVKSPIAIALGI